MVRHPPEHGKPPRFSDVAFRTEHTKLRRFHILDWLVQHQITTSLSVIGCTVAFQSLFPQFRMSTNRALKLSYLSPEGTYKQGFDDFYYVLWWVVNFTALRAIAIEWVLRPAALYLGVEEKIRLRFAEQAWLVLYYGTFWTMGMYLWIGSDYWLNNKALWIIWPAREMSGIFKWYNLVQLSFWTQQILVIYMEKRRKDHVQMLIHHFITCTLISITYVYRYTRAANVVLCFMDLVDLLLPIAKILRYLKHETACNAAFALFVIAWFLTRHVMYLRLCYDIYMDVPGPDTMLYGCYSGRTYERLTNIPAKPDRFSHLLWPFRDAEGVICLNKEVKWIFLGMLGFLHTLTMIWFTMILKVIAGILMGRSAEDTRSEDEVGDQADAADIEDEEIVDRKRQLEVTDLNICVSGSDAMANLGSMNETRSSISRAPATRRRPGLLEKELLARIGCEQPKE